MDIQTDNKTKDTLSFEEKSLAEIRKYIDDHSSIADYKNKRLELVKELMGRKTILDYGDFHKYKLNRPELKCRCLAERRDSFSLWMEEFLFYIGAYIAVDRDAAFEYIIKLITSLRYDVVSFVSAFALFYGVDRFYEYFTVNNAKKILGSEYRKEYWYSRRTKIRADLNHYLDNGYTVKEEVIFDTTTHFYCYKCIYTEKNLGQNIFWSCDMILCFPSKQKLISYLEENDKDTGAAYRLPEPLENITEDDFISEVAKGYSSSIKRFFIRKTIKSPYGDAVYQEEECFDYFDDFVSALNGNLNSADLSEYTEIWDKQKLFKLILTDAKLPPKIQSASDMLQNISQAITCTAEIENEIGDEQPDEQKKYPIKAREMDFSIQKAENEKRGIKFEKIYYITDIHLEHRIINNSPKSWDEADIVVKKVAGLLDCDGVRLIGGDISCYRSLFELFLKYAETEKAGRTVCVLGNHEYWERTEESKNEYVDSYKKLARARGVIILENELLYRVDGAYKVISSDELEHGDYVDIRRKVSQSDLLIFGATGFAGYNETFNANNGIYRLGLSRKEEVKESMRTEKIYDRLAEIIPDKKVVILTHMPFSDWHKLCAPHKGYVFVNGHTHKNHINDDGQIRIYADNQIGYKEKKCSLKWFSFECVCDPFTYLDDGIHEISRIDYIDFYRAKNTFMHFNRPVHKIYALKKNGYYCFVHQNKIGELSIMNGGSFAKLARKSLSYYFDNMDSQIARIEAPLQEYSRYQGYISECVKRFGGTGAVHGTIIDIDFWNHLYVNPINGTVTPYYATSMVDKYVYPSVSLLLEERCPELYNQYLLLSNEDNILNQIAIAENGAVTHYVDTDIYKPSRVMSKMQKLENNILTVWIDGVLESRQIPMFD